MSGQPVSLADVLRDYNRNEFHHVFPQAFLRTAGRSIEEINKLANFVFMGRQDNNTLAGEAPSKYRDRMNDTSVDDILEDEEQEQNA